MTINDKITLKWITVQEYVDIETGEMLKKYQVNNEEYIIYKTSFRYEMNEKYNLKIICYECKKNKQLRLF